MTKYRNGQMSPEALEDVVDALRVLARKADRENEGLIRSLAAKGHAPSQVKVARWDEEDGAHELPDTFHDGTPITSVKGLAAAMGVDEWTAAVYVQHKGAEHPLYSEAKATAATPDYTGTAAIMLLPRNAAKFTVDGGEEASDLHCTVFYAGTLEGLGAKTLDEFVDAVIPLQLPIVDAEFNGHTVFFNDPDKPVFVANIDSPQLETIRRKVMETFDVPQTHGFTPHMTLKYLTAKGGLPAVPRVPRQIVFDRVRVSYNGDERDIDLVPAQTYDTVDVETKGAAFGLAPEDASSWPSIRMAVKGVRHVRTPGGVRHFGQPIGSVIVADSVLKGLKAVVSEWADWDKYETPKGNYYIGKERGKWIVTDKDDNDLSSHKTREEAVKSLSDFVSNGGKRKPAAKKTAPTPKVKPKTGGSKSFGKTRPLKPASTKVAVGWEDARYIWQPLVEDVDGITATRLKGYRRVGAKLQALVPPEEHTDFQNWVRALLSDFGVPHRMSSNFDYKRDMNAFEQAVYMFGDGYGGSSRGGSSYLLQRAANEVFGLGAATEHLDEVIFAHSNKKTYAKEEKIWRRKNSKKFTEYVVRAVYEDTQEHLAAEGIKSVKVVRGLRGDYAKALRSGSTVEIDQQPVSSWTPDVDAAERFGDVVLATTVPAKRVYGISWVNGAGAYLVAEVLILGGTGDEAYVHRGPWFKNGERSDPIWG